MIIFPDINHYTSIPIVNERKVEQMFPKGTYVPSVAHPNGSQSQLIYFYPKEQNIDNKGTFSARTAPLSHQYINYEISTLITHIQKNLNLWIVDGTSDSLPQISNIKGLLEQYASHMTENSQREMLLGYLELIFTNNNWVEMKEPQIRQLSRELDRFADGNVSWKQLQLFSKQLFRSGYSTLKYDDEKQQTEKTN